MTEAVWGDAASPGIDWKMSAALQNVVRGQEELAEVTSLEGAVRAWRALDPAHRDGAILTPERPLMLDGVSTAELHGEHIAILADRLPGAQQDMPATAPDTPAA
ncbi:hypothetical protein V5740_04260 [Croceibacterium sp. TMG7-5b_MA50]|uniref:hypothetical protein n=1 Tax=Croceibacterium sp. TMG7-5b_MA50 TaxID=3121290 RepID=UPI003221AEC0